MEIQVFEMLSNFPGRRFVHAANSDSAIVQGQLVVECQRPLGAHAELAHRDELVCLRGFAVVNLRNIFFLIID